jgi:hypothetical protein
VNDVKLSGSPAVRSELGRRLDAFDATRRALMRGLEALEPAALAAQPLPGKWSILEIVEHLVLAERAVFKGMPDPSRLVAGQRGPGNQARYLLVMFVLKAGIPVRAPSRAMLPQGGRSLAELRRLWDENQVWLRSVIEALGPEGVRSAVFEHPIAGPLSVEQAVRMVQVHIDGHVKQIRTLQRLVAP